MTKKILRPPKTTYFEDMIRIPRQVFRYVERVTMGMFLSYTEKKENIDLVDEIDTFVSEMQSGYSDVKT